MASLFGSSGAVFSECGAYRYRLSRYWGDGLTVGFVMLNPSTADAEQDDPTIRRCIGFAKSWGGGNLIVGNLFALRSTDPRALLTASDPVGPANDNYLREIALQSDILVAAWGAHSLAIARGKAVSKILPGKLHCLGTTKQGHPRHPLYVPASTELFKWPPVSWLQRWTEIINESYPLAKGKTDE